MISRNIQITFIVLLTLIYSCKKSQELVVSYADTNIAYAGRIDSSPLNGAKLHWSGSSVTLNFEGQAISVLMEDDSGDNYYNVILDNDSLFIYRPDTIKRLHQLASELSKGKHSIEIFKRTEWDRGASNFYGFKIDGDAKVLPKTPPIRSIEFYGNSITAGYAVEDLTGKDSPDSTYTNNYASYAAITARHFNAKYQCICRSGIGITVSWIPIIMPELYNRLDPTDPKSSWNFSQFTPDIVVVNLFQNDSWIVNIPDNEEFKKRFGEQKPDDAFLIKAYEQFIRELRSRYPDAAIICSLGGMDAAKEGSKWIDFIKTAVTNLNDKEIYTHFMPYIEAQAHPSIEDQQKMANSLIKFIDTNIDW